MLTLRSDSAHGTLTRNSGRAYERESGEFGAQGRIDAYLTIATSVRAVCHRRPTPNSRRHLSKYLSCNDPTLESNQTGDTVTACTTDVYIYHVDIFIVLLWRMLRPEWLSIIVYMFSKFPLAIFFDSWRCFYL